MDLALSDYMQFAIVLVFVLALIFLLTWVLRNFTGMGHGQASFARKQKRLGILEGISMGGRQKLVLVRRDNVEHLLLIGGTNDLVVESAITPPPGAGDYTPPPATKSEEHIEPKFSSEDNAPPRDKSRDSELVKSKELLDRLSK